MKQKNNILSALAPALLLCAAVFGMAGCTQGEDALQGAGATAQGGEPIHVSVAPKPGFTDGTDTAGGSSTGTRATVGDDGTFGWTEGTDKIYVYIMFNDGVSTTYMHTWTPAAGASSSYITGWKVLKNWDGAGTEFTGDLVWPLGASSVSIVAFYTDCTVGNSLHGEGEASALPLSYNSGATGDHMRLEKRNLSRGEALTVDFNHATTRLVFTGLKASTAYSLKAGGTALTFPTYLKIKNLTLLDEAEQTFTSDAYGKLVICAALDDKLNATTHKVSLEVMEGNASGTSVGTVELTARGSDADGWKMDGYMYTVNFANGSGAVNPDNNPDLLAPDPIVAGNTVWKVNGYYVTAPDAVVNKVHHWAATDGATQMDFDPCAGKGDWRMPTMYDFQNIAGWTTTLPWSPNVSIGVETDVTSDTNAWLNAFPAGDYWSSVVYAADETQAWCMHSEGSGTAYYGSLRKTSNVNYIRCVQKR